MDNTTKEQRTWIIVTIVTVTILIFIFTGITYAYFTSNDNTGSTAQIITDSGKMTINYADDGSNLLVSSNISPSNNIVADKTFTLTGLNTASAGNGLSMPYKVGIKYVSSFSGGQIHYYIKKVSSTIDTITTNYTGETNTTIVGHPLETGYSHGTLDNGNKYTELVTGNFPSNKNEQSITFNLKLQFPDTGENQDSEKGKSINAEIVVNYDPKIMVEAISKLYEVKSKDENGITPDGLQKDGTGDINIKLLNTNLTRDYNITLLNNNLIADTETDEYDNLRYVGSNPNNYILFNNEIWRIIGIFNVYNTETNKYEKLTKIVRNKSLGQYSWNTSLPEINDGWGIDEWSQADLMTELNIDYLDTSKTSGNTLWYNGRNDQKTEKYDYENNIKFSYIDKIATVRWNLGGIGGGESANITYKQERGTSHRINPPDGIVRQDSWDGKVALMYASDYAYASTAPACRESINSEECKNNNWLFKSSYQWTLSPYSNGSTGVFLTSRSGNVICNDAAFAENIRPSLYLKSSVQIIGGEGTSASPYIID